MDLMICCRDFLPRGSGIVTRRPLILQLFNSRNGASLHVSHPLHCTVASLCTFSVKGVSGAWWVERERRDEEGQCSQSHWTFLKQCDMYKAAKVIHRNQSDSLCNRSHAWLSTRATRTLVANTLLPSLSRIHTCMHAHMHTHAHTHTHTHTHTHAHTLSLTRLYAHTHTCTPATHILSAAFSLSLSLSLSLWEPVKQNNSQYV